MDKIVSLCKRRGFVFPSSEIYGGLGSSYDYGHYGVLLKNNVKGRWWRSMLQERDDIVALDSAIIQHPRTWLASGHLAGFTDPLVDCRTCKLRFRADHLDQSACGRKPSKHPGETPDCDLTEARDFNLMFETTVGPVKEEGATVYLRPETAQGIFLNFKHYLQFSRKRPPFGIAQIGKSFRNEITPGNFIFRTREFEQMEMEYFVPPDEAQRWFEHWLEQRLNWYLDLGIRPDHLRLRPHDADELSHYSSGTSDVEYLFPSTDSVGGARWSELEGIANRGNFDLTQHAEYSGQKLEYVDTATKERYVPHVIEPRPAPTARCSRSWSTPTTRTRSGASRGRCSGCIRCWRRSRLRCCRSCARTGSPSSRTRSIGRCATASRPSTTRAARSAGAIAARTRSHAVGGDDRPPVARGPHVDAARPRQPRADPDRGRRPRRGDRASASRAVDIAEVDGVDISRETSARAARRTHSTRRSSERDPRRPSSGSAPRS